MTEGPLVFKAPQILFPKQFTAVSKTAPHIELTSKKADKVLFIRERITAK